MTTIRQAAAMSAYQNTIVTLDLSDLSAALLDEATNAEDAKLMGIIEGAPAYSDDERVALIVRALIDGSGLDVDDDVKNGDVWEMWGSDVGGDYRVHIRLDR